MKRSTIDTSPAAAAPELLEDKELDQVAAGAKEEMLEFPGVKGAGQKTQLMSQSVSPVDEKLEPQKTSFGGNAAEGSSHV